MAPTEEPVVFPDGHREVGGAVFSDPVALAETAAVFRRALARRLPKAAS